MALIPPSYSDRYGGYDGYHVFNDVAVLDTKTWTWTVKNTNAAVQGRADVSMNVELPSSFSLILLCSASVTFVRTSIQVKRERKKSAREIHFFT